MTNLAFIGYSLGGAGYLALTLLLLTAWRGRFQGALLIIVSALSAVWGIITALENVVESIPEWLLFVLEVLRYGGWLAFIVGLLSLHREIKLQRIAVGTVWLVCLLLCAYGIIVAIFIEPGYFIWGANKNLVLAILVLTLAGLVMIEQLYRNRTSEASSAIGYICVALGIIFVFDIYTFSNATLFSQIDESIWGVRGMINAAVIPLVALSARHNPDLSLRVFVSRQIIFYTTSLVGAGAYLLAVSIAGYYLKIYGGEWGTIIQVMFLSGAVLVLAIVLSSPTSRARIKLFLGKHFYSNKYEYREQWMRLTNVLIEQNESYNFNKRVVFAMIDVLDAKGGMLWQRQESTGYIAIAELNMEHVGITIPEDDELIFFLETRKWIIDVDELAKEPEKYGNLKLPVCLTNINDIWLVLPLLHHTQLTGFMVIGHSDVTKSLNWEDHDLLKTVAHQIASYLALIATKEELDRAHQFDAFNRLSAFVVHDLKNLVAQLGLVVKNAAKHKNNPAFMDDAINTVENAVAKMDRLLGQLRKARFERQQENNIVLNEEIASTLKNLHDLKPVPEFTNCSDELSIFADRDRMCSVIEHLVRNAQEATPDDGYVRVELNKEASNAVITISDSGSGMDKHFIQTRLFKPFQTTKGNAGMGIGVYEARQFVQKLGGSIQVASELDKGTTFRIQLPVKTVNN